ncbi:MAG: 2TM domain-containing protein [Actinomycetota bacterium]
MSAPTESPEAGDQAALAKHERQVRVFQAHAGVAAVSLAFMLGMNLMINLWAGSTDDIRAWWSLWSVVGWLPGLGLHGLVVWLARPSAVTPSSSATYDPIRGERTIP